MFHIPGYALSSQHIQVQLQSTVTKAKSNFTKAPKLCSIFDMNNHLQEPAACVSTSYLLGHLVRGQKTKSECNSGVLF